MDEGSGNGLARQVEADERAPSQRPDNEAKGGQERLPLAPGLRPAGVHVVCPCGNTIAVLALASLAGCPPHFRRGTRLCGPLAKLNLDLLIVRPRRAHMRSPTVGFRRVRREGRFLLMPSPKPGVLNV